MSEFKPCAIVPVYNHGKTVGKVVKNLNDNGLFVILVDDGSNEETKNDLALLSESATMSKLFTLEVNQGKGGAVIHGLEQAQLLGYTHGLQVDADGQHNLDMIRVFLSEAQKRPQIMIAGKPVYDETAPLGRRIGRKITNFWIAVETLSRDIPDAMCGFRMYLVDECNKLFNKSKLGRRMEFDIEIMVKLHWQGVRFKFMDVKVIYPEDGISHFRMVKDNLTIAKIHFLLFLGMIIRLPYLLVQNIKLRKIKKDATLV